MYVCMNICIFLRVIYHYEVKCKNSSGNPLAELRLFICCNYYFVVIVMPKEMNKVYYYYNFLTVLHVFRRTDFWILVVV